LCVLQSGVHLPTSEVNQRDATETSTSEVTETRNTDKVLHIRKSDDLQGVCCNVWISMEIDSSLHKVSFWSLAVQ